MNKPFKPPMTKEEYEERKQKRLETLAEFGSEANKLLETMKSQFVGLEDEIRLAKLRQSNTRNKWVSNNIEHLREYGRRQARKIRPKKYCKICKKSISKTMRRKYCSDKCKKINKEKVRKKKISLSLQ